MATEYPRKFAPPPQLSAWLPASPVGKLGRVTQLALVAVTMLVQNIMAMNVANALFLSHVGSDRLPLFFILLGIAGTAAFAAVSQVVDRFSRPRLFQYALLVGIVLVLGMRLLLNADAAPVYYGLSIAAFFQFDLHCNILFPNLLSAYLTTLEYKRYVPLMGIAQAIGILLGGGLTNLLLLWLSTPDLLFCLAAIYGLCIAQLAILAATQRTFDSAPARSELGFWETLQTLPDLTKRYPLAGYLAGSSILFILIYVLSEFLWFSTYAQNFTGDALTSFLGWIRVATSLAQLFALYCATRPLLRFLGVGAMNLAYPITSFGAFLGAALTGSLASAIAVNINGDSLNKGINTPVHQLFYNAIPPEFSSRVRVLSDGVFYALGLTLAGGLLWLAHAVLTLPQIAAIGLGLSAMLLLLRWPMSGLYVRGLEDLIRSNSLNLDEFNETPAQLPAESSGAIRELLADGDRYVQIEGLELATALGQSSLFLTEVTQLLEESEDAELQQRILQFLCANPDAETLAQCEAWLQAPEASRREIALEVCIVADRDLSEPQLRALLADSSQATQFVATLAAERQDAIATNSQIRATCNRIWETCRMQLDEAAAQALVRVATCSGDRDLLPWLRAALETGSAAVKRSGLAALATLARAGDTEIAEIVVPDLEHPEPLVRVEAFRLVGMTRCPGMLRYIGNGLCDADTRVCQAAAAALTAYGETGLSLAQDCLSSSNPDMVRMAIAAIGQIRTKRSNDILYESLIPELQPIAATSRWQQQLPADDPNWQMLAVAIADYHQRAIDKALYVLACMGYASTVKTVNQMLGTTDARKLANAVEVLASLPHRRFILPLLPVLENLGNADARPRVRSTPQWLRTTGYKLLLEALESRERWIRIGASIALATVPSNLMRDRDPLVRKVARQIFQPIYQSPSLESALMNRILLLKRIALFKHLSLDELVFIDKALVREQVLAGETIFEEGSWGTHLFIIAEGQVQIVKEINSERRELKRLGVSQYFGEIALFDDAPNPESAIALQDCALLKLEKNQFISSIAQRPQIILEICRFLSQRIREADTFHAMQRLLPPEANGTNGTLSTLTEENNQEVTQ